MPTYDIRIEHPAGIIDAKVGGADLLSARAHAEERYARFQTWDWRGLVAFVSGKKPAEEFSAGRVMPTHNRGEFHGRQTVS